MEVPSRSSVEGPSVVAKVRADQLLRMMSRPSENSALFGCMNQGVILVYPSPAPFEHPLEGFKSCQSLNVYCHF